MEGEAPHALVRVMARQIGALIVDLVCVDVFAALLPVASNPAVELIFLAIAAFAGFLIPVANVEKDLTQFFGLISDVPLSHFRDHGGPLVLEFFDQVFLHRLLLHSYVVVGDRWRILQFNVLIRFYFLVFNL